MTASPHVADGRPAACADPETAGSADELTALARVLADMPTPVDAGAADRALAVVAAHVPGIRWASLSRRGPSGRTRTIAASAEEAEATDAAQYDAGEGPCLEALDTQTVVTTDFALETRWARFVAQATAEGPTRGAISYPLAAVGHPGHSLNLYSPTAGAATGPALRCAEWAAAGLSIALTAMIERQRAENLLTALHTSRRIGTAIGILMAGRRWTSDQSFEALRQLSQHTHRKLSEVADEVVLTGALPPDPRGADEP